MAKKKSGDISTLVRRSDTEIEAKIIDLQIQISPRGRSVMNGTLLHDGMLKEIHRELTPDDVSALGRLLFGVILHDGEEFR